MLKIDLSWDSTEKAIIILPPLGIIHLVHDSGRAYYGLEILKGQYIGVSDCNVFFCLYLLGPWYKMPTRTPMYWPLNDYQISVRWFYHFELDF